MRRCDYIHKAYPSQPSSLLLNKLYFSCWDYKISWMLYQQGPWKWTHLKIYSILLSKETIKYKIFKFFLVCFSSLHLYNCPHTIFTKQQMSWNMTMVFFYGLTLALFHFIRILTHSLSKFLWMLQEGEYRNEI